jgi:branched-chain amino acid transport system substrate-binding protein
MIVMNYSAFDPDMTGIKCNFWHFRFIQNVDMSMNAITTAIAARPEIKKVHQLNQDYVAGYQAQKAFREMLPKKRADIELVGDDLVPLGKVKDFAPYAQKIKAQSSTSLEKFESVIFSGLMASEETLPSTFDGTEQLTKLFDAIRGKP